MILPLIETITVRGHLRPSSPTKEQRGQASCLLLLSSLCFILLPCKIGLCGDPLREDITGSWQGTISKKVKIDALLSLSYDKNSWNGELSVSSWGTSKFGLRDLLIDKRHIRFRLDETDYGAGEFEGDIDADHIKGKYSYNGKDYQVDLAKAPMPHVVAPTHLRIPQAPYPYSARSVYVENRGARVGAVLTIPNNAGKHPAVVLIGGSAPHRGGLMVPGDPEVTASMLSSWVFADFLTRRGWIVLRSDSRGVGLSTGNANTETIDDIVDDNVAFLKLVDSYPNIELSGIGIIGFSEGGALAGRVAVSYGKASFVGAISAPGMSGAECYLRQTDDQIRWMDENAEDALKQRWGIDSPKLKYLRQNQIQLEQNAHNVEKLEIDSVARGITPDEIIADLIKKELIPENDRARKVFGAELKKMAAPHVRSWLAYDPRGYIKQLTTPLLVIIGTKDYRVPCEENLNEFRRAVRGSPSRDVVIKALPELTHNLVKFRASDPWELNDSEEVFDPEFLQFVNDWLAERFGEPRSRHQNMP